MKHLLHKVKENSEFKENATTATLMFLVILNILALAAAASIFLYQEVKL